MKVNLDGLLRLPGARGHALKELRDNLLEVRVRHLHGEGAAALDEFFRVYVFDSARDLTGDANSTSHNQESVK